MLRTHVVIIGGGFAGLALARSLKNIEPHLIRVTVISDTVTFRYCPTLYRVATGHRDHEALIPIGEIIDDLPQVEFVHGKALRIDRKSRKVTLSGGHVLHYDFAVLSMGVVTSYFGISGLEELSYGIKSPQDIRTLRKHLHQSLIDDQAPDRNYVVVGAGPTGIELSAALMSYMKQVVRRHGLRRRSVHMHLIEAADRPAPALPEKASRIILRRLRALGVHVHLKARVESETPTTLQVNGKSIPTKTVIWTAGVTNNPFYKHNADQFTLNERGKVVVDDHLRVDPHTFVIGDNAATPYSGLALTAVHDARYVAKHIRAYVSKQTPPSSYKPLIPASVIPVGSGWSIVMYRNFVMSGRLAALVRSIADLIGYHDVMGWRKAIRAWRDMYVEDEHCALCKSQLSAHPLYEP